jgi:hypothetical protein
MAEQVLRPRSAPGAATLTDVYQADSAGVTLMSAYTVCNRSATPTTFRVAITPDGGAVSDADYIAYDVRINGNAVFSVQSGEALPPNAIIRVYNTLATLSFSFSLLKRS